MPTHHDTTPCPSCGALILWATTPAKKSMPIDAEPSSAGNVAVHRDVAGRLRARVISAERPTLEHAEHLHMPHFATCANPPQRNRPPTASPAAARRPRRPW